MRLDQSVVEGKSLKEKRVSGEWNRRARTRPTWTIVGSFFDPSLNSSKVTVDPEGQRSVNVTSKREQTLVVVVEIHESEDLVHAL